jgi:hypothetical protein
MEPPGTLPTLNAAEWRPAPTYGVLWWEPFPLTLYDDREEAHAIAEQTKGTVIVKYPHDSDWKVDE